MKLPTWLRKVPVLGWCVVALVGLLVILSRVGRGVTLYQKEKALLRKQKRVGEHLSKFDEVETAVIVKAVDDLKEHTAKTEKLRAKVENTPKLTDAINDFFGDKV